MSSTTPATVDIRQLGACGDRKATVLAAFDALARGESLVVVNDHMPNGLLRHFEEHRPGAFGWTTLEAGPGVFRVEIVRTA
ncbi:MAG TPA: DUF2249 domain-containing protein [Vicinamibacteria bacterium]|nr:DUF2249 domain-containing protein [Vicinamibacteria bacterium]